MDEIIGQFYAVYGNSYQHMCTIPRLLHTWEPGRLIDELAATIYSFGYNTNRTLTSHTSPTAMPRPSLSGLQ